MNASLGDHATLTVTLRRAGTLNVLVVDRDGFPVRQLAKDRPAQLGATPFPWDGRAEDGSIVPDEAYSFRIEWRSGNESQLYFPADTHAHMTSVTTDGYFAQSATLSYKLDVPSRVHIQAGAAVKNAKTGEMEGPVLKTVVNRAPRVAGKIAEQWNGLDESGAIFIPDLPDFVVAVAATPLPENSVITIGNRARTFTDAALSRQGKSLFTPTTSHTHHMGLSVLDDFSPGLRIEPVNATWSERDRVWVTNDATLKLRLKLTGPSANAFAKQPGRLFWFANQKLTGETKPPEGELSVKVARGAAQNISFNWRSDYGPVAANTIRVRRAGTAAGAGAKGAAR